MEICKVRWDEIDLETKALKINKFSNRRRKERVIPINGYVLSLLKEAFKTKKNDYVFPSAISTGLKQHIDPSGGIRKQWAVAIKNSGIKRHITPHDLRATFETFMHTNKNFTDTQREKMAGASIDVQKNICVTMDVEHLRGLEKSVVVSGFDKIIRENKENAVAKIAPSKRNNKGLLK